MSTRNKTGIPARRPQSPYQPKGRFSYFRDLASVAVADGAHSADPGARGAWEATAFQGDRDSEHHGGTQDARNRLSLHAEAELRDLTTSATAGGGFVPGSGGPKPSLLLF